MLPNELNMIEPTMVALVEPCQHKGEILSLDGLLLIPQSLGLEHGLLEGNFGTRPDFLPGFYLMSEPVSLISATKHVFHRRGGGGRSRVGYPGAR